MAKSDIGEIPVSTLVGKDKSKKLALLLLFDDKKCYKSGGTPLFSFK